ncbi:MAG: BON domain-containing protein [Desulfobulbus sp.]|nr:BON domain-containing protein [Desulfobulbus sp.]
MDDAATTAKVKAEIASDPMLKMSQIKVTSTKGVVRLSGAVDSQQSIDRALEITRNVKEVPVTENNLAVKSTN